MESKSSIPFKIPVKFGEICVEGVIATCSRFSSMNECLYKEIIGSENSCEILKEYPVTNDNKFIVDTFRRKKEVLKIVEFNASLDDNSVRLKVALISDLNEDLLLGCDFLRDTKSMFNYSFNSLKWCNQNKGKITNLKRLRTNNPLTRNKSLSKASMAKKVSGSFQLKYFPPVDKPATETKTSDPLTKIEASKPTTDTKTSKPTTSKKCVSMKQNSNGKPKKKSSKNQKTVYISTKIILDEDEHRFGCFSTWWSETSSKNMRDCFLMKEQSMMGLNFIPIIAVLELAIQNKIQNLRIVINSRDGLDCLQAFVATKRKIPFDYIQSASGKDLTLYVLICEMLLKFRNVEFEYVEDGKDSPKIMRDLLNNMCEMVNFQIQMMRAHHRMMLNKLLFGRPQFF